MSNERLFVSEQALELWKQLTGKDMEAIWNVYDTSKINCINVEPVEVSTFQGSNKNGAPWILVEGERFQFNRIFHSEHITDVASIIAEMVDEYKKGALDHENVDKLLSKMALVRILKTEDRALPKRSGRGTDFDKNYAMYKEAGIFLINRNGDRIE